MPEFFRRGGLAAKAGTRWEIPVAVLAICLSASTFVQAEQSDDSPLLQIHSQHAFNAIFGLPGAAARPVQSREWQLSLEHSNQFIGSMAGNEQLRLDGETSELTFRHRQRLMSCWQGELLVPFIQHSGGLFDRAIDDWHQFFGLPDANRSNVPFDELTYSYVGESGQQVQVDVPESGLGDIQLSVQRSLGCQATADSTASEAIVRVGIKLPTGSLSELRGSGKPDAYVDIQSPIWSLGERWRGGMSAGLLAVGQSSRLAPQRSVVGFGALGIQYILQHRYRLLLQVDWHTPFYDSALAELSDATVVMSGGVRYLMRGNQSFEFSIAEDIAVDTAPDIVARLAWVFRPSR
ncbi:DUF3187 family protein [Granulosicoccus antarcticus]|uniref:DUF3187 family protein n=1 Tax=Granulosicoccus antarcticus TaxID=437505 RepID=UPI0012FDD70D|nr:DUF3187 family protein [Granulosicoccus antarcticus]